MSDTPQAPKKGTKKGTKSAPWPRWVVPAAVGVVLAGVTAWAWEPRDEPEPRVQRGNRLFATGEFPQALAQYEAAPGDGVRNAGVHMNRGLSRYRIALAPNDGGVLPELGPDAAVPESWERLQDEMRSTFRGADSFSAEDLDVWLRARAAYNLGNTYFSRHDWRHAIDAYKDALRLRPGWIDPAWNLEIARRRKDEDEHPDAGPDAGQDASTDVPPSDGGSPDGGSPDGGSPDGGSPDGGGADGGASNPDGGQNPSDGGQNQGDSGSPQTPDAGGQGDGGSPPPDERDGGAGPQPDAGAPPLSLAPLDQLERNTQDLQQLLLQRRAAQTPRNPDDER